MKSRRQCDTGRRDQRRDGGMHQLPRISAKSGRSDDADCGKSVPRGCGAGDGRGKAGDAGLRRLSADEYEHAEHAGAGAIQPRAGSHQNVSAFGAAALWRGAAGGDGYRHNRLHAAGADGAKAYNELTVGTDNTDLKADLKFVSHRTDLIEDGTFDGYVAAFQKLYPNITIKYEGITDYATDMTTRLTSNDWGDLCMIPTNIPLTELGDYFEPLCALSDIENDYNFASNRAYNGSVYGIPSTGNAQGIVYNKKVFEAAGITTLPKTPDEFLDVRC